MDRGADADQRTVGEPVDARGPRVDVAVAEALLHRGGLGADPAVQVARVEQRQPHARLLGARQHRRAHRVRVVVRSAAGPVVDVVELADERHPGERHLGERGAREREHRLGIERSRGLVHLLAPRPERAARPLRAPAHRALKAV